MNSLAISTIHTSYMQSDDVHMTPVDDVFVSYTITHEALERDMQSCVTTKCIARLLNAMLYCHEKYVMIKHSINTKIIQSYI